MAKNKKTVIRVTQDNDTTRITIDGFSNNGGLVRIGSFDGDIVVDGVAEADSDADVDVVYTPTFWQRVSGEARRNHRYHDRTVPGCPECEGLA